MLALDQGDVSEELIIGVHAAARVAGGGADGAVGAHVDGRQSQVARCEVRRQSVQTKGIVRIQAAVLGDELLQEPVVPATNLEDQV